MASIKKGPGIYQVVNSVNKKRYIGHSKDVRFRLWTHKGTLKQNVHFNSHLQHSVNKYGLDKFIFEPIEYCDFDKLIEREQYWIDQFPFESLYNKTATAVPNLGKSIPSDSDLYKVMEPTMFKKGSTPWNKNKKGYMGSNTTSFKPNSSFEVVSPNGILYKGIGTVAFCKEMRLNQCAFFKMRDGIFSQHRGWTLPIKSLNYEIINWENTGKIGTEPLKPFIKQVSFEVVSKITGIMYRGEVRSYFEKEMGLSSGALTHLLKGDWSYAGEWITPVKNKTYSKVIDWKPNNKEQELK